MSFALYDRLGNAIAYSEDGIDVYLFNGRPVAYIDGDSIYAYSGIHLGWFIDGWIQDHSGNYVFFNDNSIGGPSKPFKKLQSFKSFKMFKPFKGAKQFKPFKSFTSLTWSNLSSTDFFER